LQVLNLCKVQGLVANFEVVSQQSDNPRLWVAIFATAGRKFCDWGSQVLRLVVASFVIVRICMFLTEYHCKELSPNTNKSSLKKTFLELRGFQLIFGYGLKLEAC